MNIASLLSQIPNFLIPSNTVSYQAPQQPAAPTTYNVRGTQVSPEDLVMLRNVLFAEISNRSSDKQQLEARTIANTALNRIAQYKQQGKNMTLSQVLTAPNQYQGYNSPQYQRITKNATTSIDTQKLGAIDSVLGQLKTGNFQDTTGGKVFYHHDPSGHIWLQDGSLYKQPTTAMAPANRTVADLTTP